jgi:hypothetical protein
VAPSPVTRSRSSSAAVPMTVRPRAAASCVAILPTLPPAPRISSVWPVLRPRCFSTRNAAVVAAAWLTSLRDAMRDQARRAAVLAVTAQADADSDSAQALARLTADRLDALNELLKPSGIQLAPDEYALLTGPLLARIFFERADATDDFIAAVVSQWLAARQ